jgi:hypothetical protein
MTPGQADQIIKLMLDKKGKGRKILRAQMAAAASAGIPKFIYPRDRAKAALDVADLILKEVGL